MENLGQRNETASEQRAAKAELTRRANSFGTVAAAYAEHRPDYAATAIGWALAPVRLTAGKPVRILDLGSGTGKLTAQLAGLTLGSSPVSVVAVEPDPAMLAESRRHLPPGVRAMAGRAEAIPLPDASVDAVLAGQSAHWFDLDLAMPEVSRVLVPGGVFAGLWNAEDGRIEWVTGLHRAAGMAMTLTVTATGAGGDDEPLATWLNGPGSLLFTSPEGTSFAHSQLRTGESLIQTLGTHSKFLIMEPAEREAVFARLRQYLAETGETASGPFVLPMRTLVLRTVRR